MNKKEAILLPILGVLAAIASVFLYLLVTDNDFWLAWGILLGITAIPTLLTLFILWSGVVGIKHLIDTKKEKFDKEMKEISEREIKIQKRDFSTYTKKKDKK